MSELYSASISLSFARKTWHNLGAHCTVKVKMTTYRNLFLFPAAYRSKAAAVAVGCKLTQSEKRRRDLKRIVFKYEVWSQSFSEKLTDLSGPVSTWCFFVAERALTVRSGVLGWSACPSQEKFCTCVLFPWQKYLLTLIWSTPLRCFYLFSVWNLFSFTMSIKRRMLSFTLCFYHWYLSRLQRTDTDHRDVEHEHEQTCTDPEGRHQKTTSRHEDEIIGFSLKGVTALWQKGGF